MMTNMCLCVCCLVCQVDGSVGEMGKGSNLVEHATAPADGPRSHTATRHISLQARSADTQVSSAVEGKIDCTPLFCCLTLLMVNINTCCKITNFYDIYDSVFLVVDYIG